MTVQDGASTSFWDGSWLPDGPLPELLPALHSHTTSPNATVRYVLSSGIGMHLQRRQTRMATKERLKLEAMIDTTQLTAGDDVRRSIFQGKGGKLHTSSLYKALMAASAPPTDFAELVWKTVRRQECKFWQQIGVERDGGVTVRHLDAVQRPPNFPTQHFKVFIFLCCWNIWKHRNRVVFDAIEPSVTLLLSNCREEARLWAWRLPWLTPT